MTNGGSFDGKDEGSSSKSPNANPPPTEESPRRRSGGENAPRSSPQGRAPSAPRWPPIMGVPGQSAFTPYSRPSAGSGRGASGSGGPVYPSVPPGFEGAQPVPVGGAGGGAAPGALRIGGSPAARKRVREGGAGGAAGAAGGNQPGDGGANAVNCSVCGKAFMSPKALFGHMRSHPGRGWKGAHPPPAFRAEEEFADLRADRPEIAAAPGGGRVEEVAAAGGAEGAERAAEEEEAAGAAENYRLPDLNNPPPPDAN